MKDVPDKKKNPLHQKSVLLTATLPFLKAENVF